MYIYIYNACIIYTYVYSSSDAGRLLQGGAEGGARTMITYNVIIMITIIIIISSSIIIITAIIVTIIRLTIVMLIVTIIILITIITIIMIIVIITIILHYCIGGNFSRAARRAEPGQLCYIM